MLISFFLMRIISISLTAPGQPSPRFHVEAWFPFRNCEMDYYIGQGTHFLRFNSFEIASFCLQSSITISEPSTDSIKARDMTILKSITATEG